MSERNFSYLSLCITYTPFSYISMSSLHSEIPGPDFNIDGFYECGTLFYLRATCQANWEDISDQFIEMEINAYGEIIINLTPRADPIISTPNP